MKAVGVFIRVFAAIVGVSLAIAGIVSICSISFAFAWAVAGVGIAHTTIVLHDFVALSGVLYWGFVVALYVSALVPVILLLLLGLFLVRMKRSVSLFSFLNLLVVWFIALGFAGSVVLANNQNIEQKVREIETEVRLMEEQCESWSTGFKTTCVKKVTSFGQCIEAGNPAMESHPRQCRHGDATYVEDIEK